MELVPTPSTSSLLLARRAAAAWPATVLLLAAASACSADSPAPVRDVPVFPGATLREAESRFQSELLGILLGPGRAVPPTRIYGTSASFPAVVEFYEGIVRPDTLVVRRFAVASRMREIARGIRSGGEQPERVGRLLFAAHAADSLSAPAIADSLDALASRLSVVEGAIAFARLPLAPPERGQALVTIERPHLDPSRLVVDSLTVITIAETGAAAPAPQREAERAPGDAAAP